MNIGVFCGSSSGNDPTYHEYATKTGRALAEAQIGIVYGGGRVGLMGSVADGALAAGGNVIGVIPRDLAAGEISHPGLTELIVVETMHQRKARMAELASGFIALPGGAGTLDELFEQWTWAQLGIHQKPCAVLNLCGYYTALVAMLQTMVGEGFLKQRYADMLIVEDSIETILDRIAAYKAPTSKWT